MKIYVAVGFNGILNGLIMGACSTREKAEAWIESNKWQLEQTLVPAISELVVDEDDKVVAQ